MQNDDYRYLYDDDELLNCDAVQKRIDAIRFESPEYCMLDNTELLTEIDRERQDLEEEFAEEQPHNASRTPIKLDAL